ncbi:DUF4290 domain-containing protein [Rubrivirga litoralis]|uniref:DUF4290 domain-containing protein n=1 Tax=Rubrivirga litoralis TaxID=3075598 RepID=A0ABU3BUX5_9BACT|nr:DUF4290 domain-containing protein [Rubrivirga sp. F394]MDT0633035.1 DUF4290 domain-containing protein [Rubrivirga sp. F394]
MPYDRRILDRQVGRNAQLYAEAVGALPSPAERYPYVRILVSLIETAHPEWGQAPQKASQISELAAALSDGTLDRSEIADAVRVRDEERGYGQ